MLQSNVQKAQSKQDETRLGRSPFTAVKTTHNNTKGVTLKEEARYGSKPGQMTPFGWIVPLPAAAAGPCCAHFPQKVDLSSPLLSESGQLFQSWQPACNHCGLV